MKKTNLKKNILDYFYISAGSLITAIALVSFLVPNNIVAGGVSGLAIILYRTLGWWVGAQMLLYNIVLFAIAFIILGIGFGIKSIYSAVLLSFLIDLLQNINFPVFNAAEINDGMLLATIYGGALAGIGMGIVLWRGASTGGTDIGAMIINKYLHIATGTGLLIIDSLITVLALIVFGPIVAMYGIITIFATGKTIDSILEGIEHTRTAYIMSDNYKNIKEKILQELSRGVTVLEGQGGFTGDVRPVLMVTIRRREIGQLRRIITDVDPKAFTITVNNAEVFGEGFKRLY
ncbi:MAG: YitT family protein [Kosmotoga sp.]|nr:MAG: YitT family protein [Kosmotoga sp.]